MGSDSPGDGWGDEMRRHTEENLERLDRQYRETENHLERGEVDRALDREFFVSELGRVEAKVDELRSELSSIVPLVNELLRELIRLRRGGEA